MIRLYVYLKEGIVVRIPGVTLCSTGWGETYCGIGESFEVKPHEDIMRNADRIEAVCNFTPDQGRREKGIYRSSKITAELDRSIIDKDRDYILRLKGSGYCLKEMEALYHEIRAGNIRPDPSDSYEKEQCREDPRLASTMIRKINKILFKGFFFPLGFWREVRSIVRKAESEMTA